jgi:hypothetical protein
MLYISLPLSGYEAVRLLGCILSKDETAEVIEFIDVDSEEKFHTEYKHTLGYEDHSAYYFNEQRLNGILKEKTTLRVHRLDKGVFVIGYSIPEIRANLWTQMMSVEESLVLILSRKVDWIDETNRIGMDLSKVRIASMKDISEFLFNPEPVLISWGTVE